MKSTYDNLQLILDRLFKSSPISLRVFPLTVSIGEHKLKEIYGHEDFFHVEVSFDSGSIKIPQGGTALQKDTFFFNEINTFVPKDIKRATGFISL